MHVNELIGQLKGYGGEFTQQQLDALAKAMAHDRPIRDEILRRSNQVYCCNRDLDDYGNPIPVGLVTLNLDKSATVQDINKAIVAFKRSDEWKKADKARQHDYQVQFDDLTEWATR